MIPVDTSAVMAIVLDEPEADDWYPRARSRGRDRGRDGRLRAAYRRGLSAVGKGQHPAALNFGDCFAYALAKQRDCPLLFIGRDFAQTDIVAALA